MMERYCPCLLEGGGAGQHNEVRPGEAGAVLLLDGLQQGEGGAEAGVNSPL